ncbi:NAD(P)H-dependent flavin oxidoreductase [Aerosakkonema sp. BLCC-F183]|uniref:NAD(P)H-dependent flavin oxidoreductase n=1 Tax=Aerosakkonema sp. BLCC-F183 TaxID=3342834 RepID=UPI0035BAD747
MKTLPSLQIGKHIARYPIIQGAMAVRVSGANLAGAVANAGGIGIVATIGLGLNSPYFMPNLHRKRVKFSLANCLALIDELQKARSISPHGVIGVNVLVAVRNYADLVRTAIENGANLIATAAGLPLDLPEYTANYPDTALVPTVSTVAAARTLCQTWESKYDRLPDAFIVQCSKTIGGHLAGKSQDVEKPAYKIEQLIPELADYLRRELGAAIPIIAAGGIWDKADIDAMLALGANGVQIGTRFITTHECDADIRYKEFHLNANPNDVAIVPSPLGVPGRAIRNKFAEDAIAQSPNIERRCIANCLQSCLCRDRQETYCIIQALDRAARGDVENGLIFSSANAGRAKRIMSVTEVMAELTQPARAIAPIPVFN